MGRKKTYEEVKRLVEETSDCELLSDTYEGWNKKLRFRCSCGDEFVTDWNHFSSGRKCCTDCAKTEQYNQKRHSMDYIKERIRERGAEYVSGSYENRKSRLRIRCFCGAEFERTVDSLLRSDRLVCPECLGDWRSESQAADIVSVRNELAKHGATLLTNTYKNAHQKLSIQCSCGNKFTTSYNQFVSHNKTRCRACTRRESSGELMVRSWLELNDIPFEQEKRFPDCGGKRPYPFDFYLPKQKMCIEYDGEQHSVERSYYHSSYTHEHDVVKDQYCKDNGLTMLRIDYTEKDVDKILAMSIPR